MGLQNQEQTQTSSSHCALTPLNQPPLFHRKHLQKRKFPKFRPLNHSSLVLLFRLQPCLSILTAFPPTSTRRDPPICTESLIHPTKPPRKRLSLIQNAALPFQMNSTMKNLPEKVLCKRDFMGLFKHPPTLI